MMEERPLYHPSCSVKSKPSATKTLVPLRPAWLSGTMRLETYSDGFESDDSPLHVPGKLLVEKACDSNADFGEGTAA